MYYLPVDTIQLVSLSGSMSAGHYFRCVPLNWQTLRHAVGSHLFTVLSIFCMRCRFAICELLQRIGGAPAPRGAPEGGTWETVTTRLFQSESVLVMACDRNQRVVDVEVDQSTLIPTAIRYGITTLIVSLLRHSCTDVASCQWDQNGTCITASYQYDNDETLN